MTDSTKYVTLRPDDDVDWQGLFSRLLEEKLYNNDAAAGLLSGNRMCYRSGRNNNNLPYDTMILAFDATTLLGMGSAHQVKGFQTLASVYVKPGFRGHGIGSTLIDILQERYPLITGIHTNNSHNLYRNRGIMRPKTYALLPSGVLNERQQNRAARHDFQWGQILDERRVPAG
jgi:hypothetical protein